MARNIIKNLKGVRAIYQNENYIVLTGRKLWIFRANGTQVACRTDLGPILKLVFLPKDQMLADCGRQEAYILLSLVDGSEIWRLPYPKIDYTTSHFALSPDNEFVYDYGVRGEKYVFIRIDLTAPLITSFFLKGGLRSICDIMCDTNGIPCLLECHWETPEKTMTSINGIRYEPQNSSCDGSVGYWKCLWEFSFPRISKFFLANTQSILTNDLWVYDPHSKEAYFLLENDPNWEFPGHCPSSCRVDVSNQYIILMYTSVNVVIDWKNREMLARYAADYRMGSIIKDEYWICSDSGICRKPFPLIEDIPTPKLSTFFDK